MDNEVVFTIALIMGIVGVYGIYPLLGSSQEDIVTVQQKWIKSQGKNDMTYLFSDENGNVYSIQDSWWKMTFDASDRYAKLKIGRAYRIETFGRRLHVPTNYPNAIHIEEV